MLLMMKRYLVHIHYHCPPLSNITLFNNSFAGEKEEMVEFEGNYILENASKAHKMKGH